MAIAFDRMQEITTLMAMGRMSEVAQSLVFALQETQAAILKQEAIIQKQCVEIACLKDRLMDAGILQEARP